MFHVGGAESYFAVLSYLSAGIYQVAQAVLLRKAYISEMLFNAYITCSLLHLDGYAKQNKGLPAFYSFIF